MSDAYDFDITTDIPDAPAPAMAQQPQSQALNTHGGPTPDPADANLLVKFYFKSVENKASTFAAGGIPQYVEKEYIDIRVAGKYDPIVRPATFADKNRFPQHYAAFKNRMEMPNTGYPLVEWSIMPRSLVDMFSFHNIKTVEQLATLSDVNAGALKGAAKFKQLAIVHLEKLKDEGKDNMLAEQLKERDDEIGALKDQMADQSKQINEMMALMKEKDSEVVDPVVNEAANLTPEVLTPTPTKRRKIKG